MELRLARLDANGEASIDHIPLGDPGDHGVVTLIDVDLEAAVPGSAFEVTAGGDLVVTANGRNYTIHPCAVRQESGAKSSMFYFIGVPTAHVPKAP
jgi:hypothetical protein